MREKIGKLLFASVLLLVFLVSFFAASLLFYVAPFGHYSARGYSNPTALTVGSETSSVIGGAWKQQMLSVYPYAGASNVPCDTSIVIDAPRPVRVANISLSPSTAIAKQSYVVYSGFSPSSTQTVYPAGLLQPNTTYNVSATVASTPSWWAFTTSLQPSKLTYTTHMSLDDSWFALVTAVSATLVAASLTLRKQKKQGLLHEVGVSGFKQVRRHHEQSGYNCE